MKENRFPSLKCYLFFGPVGLIRVFVNNNGKFLRFFAALCDFFSKNKYFVKGYPFVPFWVFSALRLLGQRCQLV